MSAQTVEEIVARCQELHADTRFHAAREWKEAEPGRKVVGYMPIYVPREIIHAGLVNEEFVRSATDGFDEYAAAVEPCTLEWAEEKIGVPAAAIADLAHAYGKAPTAQLCWTLGITEHHTGADNVFALINQALLTGHVGRYGSGLVPIRGQNNVQGGGDMGALPNKLPGFQDVADDTARGRFEARGWRRRHPAQFEASTRDEHSAQPGRSFVEASVPGVGRLRSRDGLTGRGEEAEHELLADVR